MVTATCLGLNLSKDCEDYLAKPYDFNVLIERIETLLEKKEKREGKDE